MEIRKLFADRFPYLAAYALKLLRGGPDYSKSGSLWRIADDTGCIYIPFIRRYSMYCNSVASRISYMFDRYPLGDLSNSLVLDVGAHVGEYALAASKLAQKVICFEPDPFAREALIRNTSSIENIEVMPIALSNKTGVSTFFIATEHADSSLFEPDKFTSKIQTQVMRLDDLSIDTQGYRSVVLKMDAEGFEPEVLEGGLTWIQSHLHVAAIDVAPERAGSDTYQEVKRLLESIGFKLRAFTVDQVVIMEKN